MAVYSFAGYSFDIVESVGTVSPAAAYSAWALELGLPDTGTLQVLGADDQAFVLTLASPVIGDSTIACFASEGGIGVYRNAPTVTGSVSTTLAGVSRMYSLTSPAPLFFTFHPNTDCRSEGVKVQRSATVTILTGVIRKLNNATYVLNFAVRIESGSVLLILNPVDQPVPLNAFVQMRDIGASFTVSAGATRQFAITGVAYSAPVYFGVPTPDVMALGTGPAMTYGTPQLDATVYLGIESGSVKDQITGVLGQGIGRVQGSVAEKHLPTNTPWSRKVRLIRERDGMVIREMWSDPITGAYDFQYIDEIQLYTVVSYDYTGAHRAVIADRIVPELMP